MPPAFTATKVILFYSTSLTLLTGSIHCALMKAIDFFSFTVFFSLNATRRLARKWRAREEDGADSAPKVANEHKSTSFSPFDKNYLLEINLYSHCFLQLVLVILY